MTNLPDFTELFVRAFRPSAGAEEPIRFEAREGPNYPHDIVFLASLLQDALWSRRRMRFDEEKGVLTLDLERTRWELFTEESRELLSVQSRLVLTRVSAIELEVSHPAEIRSPAKGIEITDVYYLRQRVLGGPRPVLLLSGYACTLRVVGQVDESIGASLADRP